MFNAIDSSFGFVIEWPNQVWRAGVTYIPMRKTLVYLVAIMDWV